MHFHVNSHNYRFAFLLFKRAMQNANLAHIFQLLNGQFGQAPKVPSSKIKLSNSTFLVSEEQFSSYSEEIKSIYSSIFYTEQNAEENKDAKIDLNKSVEFPVKKTDMPICNKILTVSEEVFRCYDCMTHEASVLCKKCFENGDHKGHRYNQISSGGGNCDCGNPDAVKPCGFCKHHPGKADPVQIDPKEKEHFVHVFSVMWQWVFRLFEKQMFKSSDSLGYALGNQLMKLNEQSLYYNTLTYHLLFSNRSQAQTKVIRQVFQYGIKCVNMAKKMTDLFFNMFSLDVFKYQLSVEYCKAANTLPSFESSKFKSLYIQLFANNEIIEKMLKEEKLVLYPEFPNYNYSEYSENLMFLTTINKEVAGDFFAALMQKGIVRMPVLDQIEESVEVEDRHIAEVIGENLNSENIYYTLLTAILSLVKNKPETIKTMFQNYFYHLRSQKYSYKNNKVVLPFQKMFGLILFVYSKGDIHNLDATKIVEDLLEMGDQKQFVAVVKKVFRNILMCFQEFAVSFFEHTYFEGYIPLYLRSGNKIVMFDMLIFRICILLLKQLGMIDFIVETMLEVCVQKEQTSTKKSAKEKNKYFQKKQSEALKNEEKSKSPSKMEIEFDQNPDSKMEDQNENDWIDIEEESQENKIQNQDKPNETEFRCRVLFKCRKTCELFQILIQACISDRVQTFSARNFDFDDPYTMKISDHLLGSLFLNYKELTSDELKMLFLHFAPKDKEAAISQFLTYDRVRNKYIVKTTLQKSQIQRKKLPLKLFPTLSKIGQIFNVSEESLNDILKSYDFCEIQPSNVALIRELFNENLLWQISQSILHWTVKFGEQQKLFVSCLSKFIEKSEVLNKIFGSCELEGSNAINEFFNSLKKQSETHPFIPISNQCDLQNNEKQFKKTQLMAKFNEKKKKKLQKMKQLQQKFDLQQKVEMKDENQNNASLQQSDDSCIICHDSSQNSKGLCFLGSFNYNNLLESICQSWGHRSLHFKCCFHPIHVKCFLKTSNNSGYMPCPLCKSQSNLLIPTEKQNTNGEVVLKVFERIKTLKATFMIEKSKQEKYEELSILPILRSIASCIVRNVLNGQQILKQKQQRLSNILFDMVKYLLDEITLEEASKERSAIENFLGECLTEISESSPYRSNFVLLMRTVIKNLFQSMFRIKSEEPKLHQFVNGSDLLKTLQMTNQILSVSISTDRVREQWNELCQRFDNISEESEAKRQFIGPSLNSLVQKFYSPPKTVYQLLKIRDSAQFSCKNGHHMCICLICNTKACYSCKQMPKHIHEAHCSEALAFDLLTGGFVWCLPDRSIKCPSLYTNKIGREWTPAKDPEGFEWDDKAYQDLKSSVLNLNVRDFLLKRYPDMEAKGSLGDLITF